MARVPMRRESAYTTPTWRTSPFNLFDDLMNWDPFGDFGVGARGRMQRAFVPSFDVKEDKDNYVIEADLPGVREEDLDVTMSNGMLRISGKREHEERDESGNYHVYEREYGEFTRSFTLPENVDREKIEASLESGVLKVVIPKGEEAKPRKISIAKRVKEAMKKAG